MTRESDIAYENGKFWVLRDAKAKRYTVFAAGVTHSVSDSSYAFTADGLSIAKARTDYLANPDAFREAVRQRRLAKSRPVSLPVI